MTRQEVIEDLKTLRAYFLEETGGSVPICIDEAIRIINEEEETS
jgi:hypothetical protein